MSKITETYHFHGCGYVMDCGHRGHTVSNRPKREVGDELPCETCIEIQAAQSRPRRVLNYPIIASVTFAVLLIVAMARSCH